MATAVADVTWKQFICRAVRSTSAFTKKVDASSSEVTTREMGVDESTAPWLKSVEFWSSGRHTIHWPLHAKDLTRREKRSQKAPPGTMGCSMLSVHVCWQKVEM